MLWLFWCFCKCNGAVCTAISHMLVVCRAQLSVQVPYSTDSPASCDLMFTSRPQYISINKEQDNDWFTISSNKDGTTYVSPPIRFCSVLTLRWRCSDKVSVVLMQVVGRVLAYPQYAKIPVQVPVLGTTLCNQWHGCCCSVRMYGLT
jgi:hypothetical protein